MKLEAVSKLKNENSDDGVICDVIVTFAIYCQFEAIQKLDLYSQSEIQRILD